MKGTVELTPDQLAQLVCAVFEANGFKADGLSLELQGQLVGFDRAVIHYDLTQQIAIYPKPVMTREQLDAMLNPYATINQFASRADSGDDGIGDTAG